MQRVIGHACACVHIHSGEDGKSCPFKIPFYGFVVLVLPLGGAGVDSGLFREFQNCTICGRTVWHAEHLKVHTSKKKSLYF